MPDEKDQKDLSAEASAKAEETKEEKPQEESQPKEGEPQVSKDEKADDDEAKKSIEEKSKTEEPKPEAQPVEEKPAESEAKAKPEPTGKFKDLIKEIEGLTTVELAELVKELEKRFGVSAAAPVA